MVKRRFNRSSAFQDVGTRSYTGLFEKIVGILTTCHTQHT